MLTPVCFQLNVEGERDVPRHQLALHSYCKRGWAAGANPPSVFFGLHLLRLISCSAPLECGAVLHQFTQGH